MSASCEDDRACTDTSEDGQSYTCTEHNDCEHHKLNVVRINESENATEKNEILAELRSLVCNKSLRKVCCRNEEVEVQQEIRGLLELDNADVFKNENETYTFKVTPDILHEVLDNAATSHFIELELWNQLYNMSPYFIALPQTVLNIGVVSVILLSLILKNEKPTPNILFLLNLSFTDLVQAVLLFIVVKYFNFNEYDSGNPDVFAEQATNGCHNKSTIICFLYSQSMLATIIVTLDRYLTISFPFKHKDLMTKRIVLLLVILSWLLPIIFAASIGPVIGASIPNQETINSTHMASSIPKTFLVCLIMVVLCSTYGAYFKIIFAHWSLKRKHSVMRKSISSMGYNSSTNTIKQIYENVERLGRYIKDSKYVIVLLIVFTLCWFPWVVAYTVDISYHSLDLHRHQIQVLLSFIFFHDKILHPRSIVELITAVLLAKENMSLTLICVSGNLYNQK